MVVDCHHGGRIRASTGRRSYHRRNSGDWTVMHMQVGRKAGMEVVDVLAGFWGVAIPAIELTAVSTCL